MKKKKILISIPIILIVLLVLIIAVGVFILFKTDLFKSPKQLFFKYLVNTVETNNNYNYDEFLEQYKEISEKSYTSNGKITAQLNYDNLELELSKYNTSSTSNQVKSITTILDTTKDTLDKTRIEYHEESIPTKERYHINIKPFYNGNEITNIELLTSGENYGIKCSELYDKYIYIENNNLKQLATKLGLSSSNIPDKINTINTYELLYINPDIRKQIIEKYTIFFNEKLTNNMFTSTKKVSTSVNGENVEANSYTLTLNGEQAYDILVNFLETLKDDDTTLDLIVQKMEQSGMKESLENSYNSYSSYNSSLYTSSSSRTSNISIDKDFLKDTIQDMIDELEEDKSSFSADKKIEFIVYSYKGKTVKLEIKNSEDNNAISIEISNKESENIITINNNESTLFKANYTTITENNIDKTVGNVSIYDIDNNETTKIDFNIELGKSSSKLNMKFYVENNSDTDYKSNSSLTNNASTIVNSVLNSRTIELNLESNGQIGKDNVTTTGYINVGISGVIVRFNINQTTTYTNNINIDDLTSNNGELLNTMSNTKMNTLIQEISNNLQEVLPEKAKLLGLELPTNTAEENSSVNTENNNENTSIENVTIKNNNESTSIENVTIENNNNKNNIYSNEETNTNTQNTLSSNLLLTPTTSEENNNLLSFF